MTGKLMKVLGAVLIAGLSISAFAQRSLPPRGDVVDATGKKMGPAYLVSGRGPLTALVRVGADLLNLPLQSMLVDAGENQWEDPLRLVVPQGGQVYFEGVDCTGTAWITENSYPPGTAPARLLGDGRGVAYAYIANIEPPQVRQALSYLEYDATGVHCRESIASAPSISIRRTVDLSTYFTPPYRLR